MTIVEVAHAQPTSLDFDAGEKTKSEEHGTEDKYWLYSADGRLEPARLTLRNPVRRSSMQSVMKQISSSRMEVMLSGLRKAVYSIRIPVVFYPGSHYLHGLRDACDWSLHPLNYAKDYSASLLECGRWRYLQHNRRPPVAL